MTWPDFSCPLFEVVCGTWETSGHTHRHVSPREFWPEKYAVAWDLGICIVLKVGNGRDESREEMECEGKYVV